MIVWEPHIPRGRLRVTETSCCAAYEWACEGGQYFVLRRAAGRYEETGRGIYREARAVWNQLVEQHVAEHTAAFPRRWTDSIPNRPD